MSLKKTETIDPSPLGPLTPELRKLTKAGRKVTLSIGCEPTCHFCGKRVRVGDEFAFHRVALGRDDVLQGSFPMLPNMAMRMMACATCVDTESRPIPRVRGEGCCFTDDGQPC